MKKMTALLLVLLLLCSLTACSGENASSSSAPSLSTNDSSSELVSEPAATSGPTPTPEPTPTAAPAAEEPVSEAEPDTGTKVLVAYFSATGNTRPLAEYMADGLGADLYEITPEEPYTDADLDYGNSNSRTSIEMNDPNSRPAISGSVETMEQYEIVFVGYPIWWGGAPHILYTFMESYDWSGKTVIPFCTSGSSPIGSSAANLESLASGGDWLPGQRFSGGASQEEVLAWVNSLDLELN